MWKTLERIPNSRLGKIRYAENLATIKEVTHSFGFDKSWQFYNYFANTDAIFPAQNVTKNPNKALVTINGKNSEVTFWFKNIYIIFIKFNI